MTSYLEAPVIVAAVSGVLAASGMALTAYLQTKMRRDIKTNHGSKNMGDAVDRLTERVLEIGTRQIEQGEQLLDLRTKMNMHLVAIDAPLTYVHALMNAEGAAGGEHGED